MVACCTRIQVFDSDEYDYTSIKHEQVVEWRASRDVELQFAALIDGFREVVPLEWLRAFDERELEVCVSYPIFVLAHFPMSTRWLRAGAPVRHADGGDRRGGLAPAHDLSALLGAQQTGAVVLEAGGRIRPPPAPASLAVRHRHLPPPARRLRGARRYFISSARTASSMLFSLPQFLLIRTRFSSLVQHSQEAMVHSASASRNSAAPTRYHVLTPASTASTSRFELLLFLSIASTRNPNTKTAVAKLIQIIYISCLGIQEL